MNPKTRYPPGWAYDGGSQIEIESSPMHKTWGMMEKCVEMALAKNIGVSNFAGGLLMDVMTYAKIPPAVLEVEMHP